jgi:hypothetical protein
MNVLNHSYLLKFYRELYSWKVIIRMTYMENEKYKLVDGFGPYNNHRYEILEKDFY